MLSFISTAAPLSQVTGHTLTAVPSQAVSCDLLATGCTSIVYLFGGSFEHRASTTASAVPNFSNTLYTYKVYSSSASSSNQQQQQKATWQKVDASPLPKARNFHTAIFRNNKTATAVSQELIIFGGKSNGYLNDTWSFNLTTNEWKQLDTQQQGAPLPRYGTSNGSFFLFYFYFNFQFFFSIFWFNYCYTCL